MRTPLLLALATLVWLPSACSKPITGPSFHPAKGTTYFGDVYHDFSYTVAAPVKVDLGPGVGYFLVTTLDGQFFTFDLDQGKRQSRKVWAKLPKGVRGTPLSDYVNKQLIVGCYDQGVYALDMGNGGINWRAQLDGYVQASVALVGPAAVVGSLGGSVYGISPIDGSTMWNLPLGGGIYGAAGVHPEWKDRALVGTDKGKCAIIDTVAGTAVAEFQVTGGLEAGPAIAASGGQVYAFIGTREGELSAWSIGGATPQKVWTKDLDGKAIWATPAVAPAPGGAEGAVVYAVSNASKLWALDALTGNEIWTATFSPADQLHATPLVVGDRVYVGSLNHHLYYINRVDGSPIEYTDPATTLKAQSFVAFGEFRAAPILDRDRLIAVSNDHFLYGLDWELPRPIVGNFKPGPAPEVLDLTRGGISEEAPEMPEDQLEQEIGGIINMLLAAIKAGDATTLAAAMNEPDANRQSIFAAAAIEAFRPYKLGEPTLTSVVPATAGDLVAGVLWQASKPGQGNTGDEHVQLILNIHLVKDATKSPTWRVEPETLKVSREITVPVLSN